MDLNQPDLDDSDGGYSDYGDLEETGGGERPGETEGGDTPAGGDADKGTETGGL